MANDSTPFKKGYKSFINARKRNYTLKHKRGYALKYNRNFGYQPVKNDDREPNPPKSGSNASKT